MICVELAAECVTLTDQKALSCPTSLPKTIFTEKQVDISALLAGPIPPGILIYRNYMALGKTGQAYVTLATTLIFTMAFFYALLHIPDAIVEKIPGAAFSVLYGILIFIFFRLFMAREVTSAMTAGIARRGSNWSVTGITVLGLVINLGIIFGLAAGQPVYEGIRMEVDGNDLYYLEPVTEQNAQKLADVLKTSGFFGHDLRNVVRLEFDDSEYLITVVANEQYWKHEGMINYFKGLRVTMEVEFGGRTRLQLEAPTAAGIGKHKQI